MALEWPRHLNAERTLEIDTDKKMRKKDEASPSPLEALPLYMVYTEQLAEAAGKRGRSTMLRILKSSWTRSILRIISARKEERRDIHGTCLATMTPLAVITS